MKRNPEIGKELYEISPALANLSAMMPFHLPEGYFDRFPESLIQLLNQEKLPGTIENPIPIFPPKSSVSLPFSVPEGYFDQLSGNILSKIRDNENESAAAEIMRISPLLAEIDRGTPFSLPTGYFENLDIKTMVAVPEQKETARIVVMSSHKRWMNYAAAAVITAIIGGALYFYSTITGTQNLPSEGVVAQAEIPVKDSLQLSQDAISSFLAQTEVLDDNEELDLEMFTRQKDLAILDINETTIQNFLQEIPDAVIEDYITENPGSDPAKSLN